MSTNNIWSLNNKGEIVNECLQRNNKKRYKPDTPFDNSFVPYLIMIFCAMVDGLVFYSLFSKISYDSPMMLMAQIIGLLLGYDVAPIFMGIQYRRLRQGLTKDKFTLIMALVVCGIAISINIALRIVTIDLNGVSTISTVTSYVGASTQEVTDTGLAPSIIASTIFGIGVPIVTSLTSLLVSFMTYNPLDIKKRRLVEMLEDTRDEVRRLDAIIEDYDLEQDFAEQVEIEDKEKYRQMQKMHKAMVIGYCDYVRERLKEQLGNPSSNNVLSAETYETLLARLDKEQACMEGKLFYTVVPEENKSKYSKIIHANKATV